MRTQLINQVILFCFSVFLLVCWQCLTVSSFCPMIGSLLYAVSKSKESSTSRNLPPISIKKEKKKTYLEIVVETGSKIYICKDWMNKRVCRVYTKLRKCLRNVTVAASWLEKHFVIVPWLMLYNVQMQWNEVSTAVWKIETEWNPSLLPWMFVVDRLPYSSPCKQMVALLVCQVCTDKNVFVWPKYPLVHTCVRDRT